MTTFPMPPSVIHKFEVPIKGATLPLSQGSPIVHVAMQGGAIHLWAQRVVNREGQPSASGPGRRFEVYDTGHPIPGKREHVGSVIDGPFVWHVMEVKA